MRALEGGIPRAFKSHKTPKGHAYRTYVLAICARLGWQQIPAAARPTVREAGKVSVDLEELGFALEVALARKRRKRRTADADALERERRALERDRRDVNRLRKNQFMLREQLLRLERRLEELAGRGHGHGDPLAAVKRAVEAANQR